jgi:hypothetical protein
MDEKTLELVKARREELACYRKDASDAAATQLQRVWIAERELKQATDARDKSIAKFEKAVRDANAEPTSLQMSVGSVKIYGDRAAMGNQVVQYADDTHAWVETSGSVYTTTSTRTKGGVSIPGAVVGGMIAGPIGVVVGGHKTKHQVVNQVHDDRTLFFEIRGSGGNASWQLPVKYEAQARQAAAQVANFALTLDDRRKTAESSASYYLGKLTEAKNDTAAIEKAEHALAIVKADNAEEMALKAAYDDKEASFLALVAEINAQAVEAGEKAPFKDDGTPRLGVDKSRDRPFVIAAAAAAVLVVLFIVWMVLAQ